MKTKFKKTAEILRKVQACASSCFKQSTSCQKLGFLLINKFFFKMLTSRSWFIAVLSFLDDYAASIDFLLVWYFNAAGMFKLIDPFEQFKTLLLLG